MAHLDSKHTHSLRLPPFIQPSLAVHSPTPSLYSHQSLKHLSTLSSISTFGSPAAVWVIVHHHLGYDAAGESTRFSRLGSDAWSHLPCSLFRWSTRLYWPVRLWPWSTLTSIPQSAPGNSALVSWKSLLASVARLGALWPFPKPCPLSILLSTLSPFQICIFGSAQMKVLWSAPVSVFHY